MAQTPGQNDQRNQKNKIYVIGIGGSGAKCVESLVYLSAIGLLDNSELKILLVDADADNGNSQRTIESLKLNQDVKMIFNNNTFLKSSFMRGNFELYPSWNPLSGLSGNNLELIFLLETIRTRHRPLGDLFDALYNAKERTAPLDVGFRGKPPIGSAVVSRLNLDFQNGVWAQFINNIRDDANDANTNVTIHLFGSIFGGTGAAGLPTLASILDEKLRLEVSGQENNDNPIRNSIRLNATLLLPYFEFDRPTDQASDVYAESQFFPLNTQAALSYFTTQPSQSIDNLYLVGNTNNSSYTPSTGNTTQLNEANIVEIYAALAVAHGVSAPLQPDSFKVSFISRGSPNLFEWDDFPPGVNQASFKDRISTAVRFAYAWKYNISLELNEALIDPLRFSRGAPWFHRLFRTVLNDESPEIVFKAEHEASKELTKWCDSFLLWASQIGESTAEDNDDKLINLNQEYFSKSNGRYAKDILSIVKDEGEVNSHVRRSRKLHSIKDKLADIKVDTNELGGIRLLAHSLLRHC